MKKIIKEKIYELKITDDMEDESGIDSISLVDTPAIEINWVAFSKEKEHDFHIPDGEDHIYLEKLLPFGQDEQELLDEGYEIDSIEYKKAGEFIYSNPNQSSDLDTNLFRIRYKYMLNPQAGGKPIISTTRDFCKELIQKNLVFRLEDMLNQQNDEGDSFADWRGGYNCRHIFGRIIYKKKGDIKNNAGGKREDSLNILGSPQNDTRTSNPSFNKEKLEKGVPHYTKDGKLYTGPTHKNADGRLMSGAVHTEDSVYLYHEGEYDSYTDYPDSVKNNAKAVLKWVEENGWGSCGTPVGKTRVNQLAKGEPISEDTIKRMYSYLSRHKVDLESSKGYDDGCGKLMYDSWGGLSALSWTESKVKTFGYDNNLPSYVDELPKKKKKQFVTDSEKRTIIGPAMVPDMLIFRKDIFGTPYKVFFTKETISQIAEKYMRNKYLDNNDLMHDGKAVSDVYVVESWIVEDPETDKSKKYGFDVPTGTWMIAMKCGKTPKGDEVWEQIKSKKLQGFSVSGFFIEQAASFAEELFLQEVAQILSKIKE